MRRAHPGEVGALTGPSAVGGHCDPAFAAVRDAFEHNFIENDELGASLCVIADGRPVVDLWGGLASEDGAPWGPDTLVNAFSVGKGVTAVLAGRAVALGHLSYDDTVRKHWPGFTGGGKETLTVRDLLAHRAGLPAVRRPLHETAMLEWDTMTTALADETPWWEPGTRHGYHVNTFGFLVGEVLRRATGHGPGALLERWVRGALGADLWFGVPAEEHGRIADLRWNANPTVPGDTSTLTEEQLMHARAHVNPPGLSGVGWVNTPRWRSGEMPSTNLHASARGVARLYWSLVDGFLPPAVLADAATEVSNGIDAVLGRTTRFGAGFQLPIPERGFGPGTRSFGHYGAGGSMGFVDPEARVSVGYVMNRMGQGWQNPRNKSIIAAVFA